MSHVTIKEFATVVGIPTERLLMQFEEAGIRVSGSDAMISDQQKMDLLAHLRKSHGKKGALGISGPKKITLNRKTHSEIKLGGGTTGQAKTVSVEVRKKRTYVKRSVVLGEDDKHRVSESQEAGLDENRPVVEARTQEAEAQHQVQEAEAQRQAQEAEAQRQAQEAEAQRQAQEAEAQRQAQEAEAQRQAQEAKTEPQPETTEAQVTEVEAPRSIEEAKTPRKGKVGEVQRKAKPEASTPKTGRNKAAPTGKVAEARAKKPGAAGEGRGVRQRPSAPTDRGARRRSRKGRGGGRATPAAAPTKHGFARPTAPIVHEVMLPETISVADLAQKMSIKATEVIKALMKLGSMVTINQVLDQDTAAIVVEELGHTYKLLKENALEEELAENVSGNNISAE